MTRLSCVIGVVTLLGANARAAEHDWPALPRAEDAEERVSLAVSYRAGLVEAPFVTTAFPEVSGFGSVLIGTASLAVSPVGWLRVRLPISLVRLDFPARAQVSEAALGNLELGLEHGVELRPSTRVSLLAAVLTPSAEHGPSTSLLNHRALALGSALNGGKDAALLTPGVIGLRLGANLGHSHGPFEFRAALDVPLLVRVSDASLPQETETNPMGIVPALDLRAAVWIVPWLGASVGVDVITEPLRVTEPALERNRRRRLQGVVEPGLHVRLGQRVGLGLDASVPVGGNLGGEVWSIDTHARWAL